MWSLLRLCRPSISAWKLLCPRPRSLTLSSITFNLFPEFSGFRSDHITWTTLKIHDWLYTHIRTQKFNQKQPTTRTSCCCTDSKRPHHCCHRTNKTWEHRPRTVCSLYLTMGWEMPPKLLLHLGDPSTHLVHGWLGSFESISHMAPRSDQPFCMAYGRDRQTQTTEHR